MAIVAMGLLVWSQAAAAASWSVISLSAEPQNVGAIVDATDKLMSSAAGKKYPGRLYLQMHVADGANPATHSFVPVYKSAADREAFLSVLEKDPAWVKFRDSIAKLSRPASRVMHRTQARWGKMSDDNHVWQSHAFTVRDPAAFHAALDKFMTSKTGKGFAGEVFLSGVVAAGMSPVTHVITVGYESEAQQEAWQDSLMDNADWDAYLDSSRQSAEYLGNNLVRDIRAWGATLEEVTAQ